MRNEDVYNLYSGWREYFLYVQGEPTPVPDQLTWKKTGAGFRIRSDIDRIQDEDLTRIIDARKRLIIGNVAKAFDL